MTNHALTIAENQARSALNCLKGCQAEMVGLPSGSEFHTLRASYSTAVGALHTMKQQAKALRERQ